MKSKELRTMSAAELKEKLAEIEMELMKENAQIAIGTVPKNPGRVGQAKKARARILAELGRKEVARKI